MNSTVGLHADDEGDAAAGGARRQGEGRLGKHRADLRLPQRVRPMIRVMKMCFPVDCKRVTCARNAWPLLSRLLQRVLHGDREVPQRAGPHRQHLHPLRAPPRAALAGIARARAGGGGGGGARARARVRTGAAPAHVRQVLREQAQVGACGERPPGRRVRGGPRTSRPQARAARPPHQTRPAHHEVPAPAPGTCTARV